MCRRAASYRPQCRDLSQPPCSELATACRLSVTPAADGCRPPPSMSGALSSRGEFGQEGPNTRSAFDVLALVHVVAELSENHRGREYNWHAAVL
jgi:hypothetical protein